VTKKDGPGGGTIPKLQPGKGQRKSSHKNTELEEKIVEVPHEKVMPPVGGKKKLQEARRTPGKVRVSGKEKISGDSDGTESVENTGKLMGKLEGNRCTPKF